MVIVGVFVIVAVKVLVGVTVGVLLIVGVTVLVTVGVGVGVEHKQSLSEFATPLPPLSTTTLVAQVTKYSVLIDTETVSIVSLQL